MRRAEATAKFKEDRGHYFHNAIDIPMAEKYGLSLRAIADLRTYAIYRGMLLGEIAFYITEKLNEKAYDKNKRGKKLKKIREEILKFVLHCKPEAFEEITRKTKYDYED